MKSLLVATGNELASLIPGDGRWEVSKGLPESYAQCLAFDLRQPDHIYVGTHGKGLWKSIDRGVNWEDTHLPHPDIFSVALSPIDGKVYVGCEPSMLFFSSDEGRSWRELESLHQIPSAPTWSFPPRPWTSHVRWVAPSPHDAQLLLVGIELGGLMVTQDGGETWLDHRPGAQRDVHALTWHPSFPGRAYEAGGEGAAWSKDGGINWSPADEGRDRHYTWGLTVDPLDPDCWYVSASTGPRAAHGGQNAQAFIYRWKGEGPWQALGGGLPQPLIHMPYALVANEDSLYAGMSNGEIYASQDRGDTWYKLNLFGEKLDRIVAMILL